MQLEPTLWSVQPPDAVAVGVGLEEKFFQELPELDSSRVVWRHRGVWAAGGGGRDGALIYNNNKNKVELTSCDCSKL